MFAVQSRKEKKHIPGKVNLCVVYMRSRNAYLQMQQTCLSSLCLAFLFKVYYWSYWYIMKSELLQFLFLLKDELFSHFSMILSWTTKTFAFTTINILWRVLIYLTLEIFVNPKLIQRLVLGVLQNKDKWKAVILWRRESWQNLPETFHHALFKLKLILRLKLTKQKILFCWNCDSAFWIQSQSTIQKNIMPCWRNSVKDDLWSTKVLSLFSWPLILTT